MPPSATKGFVTIVDTKQIGKVSLIFEKYNKYPWLSSLLAEQYETDIDGNELVEHWYTDIEDDNFVYKYDDDTIKYYAVDPSIVEVKLLSLIEDNTPNTAITIPFETNTKQTIAEMRANLIKSLFTNIIKVTIMKSNFKSKLSAINDMVFLEERSLSPSVKAKVAVDIVPYVSLPRIYPQVDERDFNPVDLNHRTTTFDDRYQEEDASVSSVFPTIPTSFDFSDIVTAIKETADIYKANTPVAPIDTHSAYVTWNHWIFPPDVQSQCLIKQISTVI